jgi:hypothetical protein
VALGLCVLHCSGLGWLWLQRLQDTWQAHLQKDCVVVLWPVVGCCVQACCTIKELAVRGGLNLSLLGQQCPTLCLNPQRWQQWQQDVVRHFLLCALPMRPQHRSSLHSCTANFGCFLGPRPPAISVGRLGSHFCRCIKQAWAVRLFRDSLGCIVLCDLPRVTMHSPLKDNVSRAPAALRVQMFAVFFVESW